MMPETISLFSAFAIGLAGGLHCIAMCGGISGALGFIAGKKQYLRVLAYNLGRITSYAIIGFIVGTSGWILGKNGEFAHITLKIISGVLLILIGVQVSGIQHVLYWLEKAGSFVWQYISPLGKALLPVDNLLKAWLFGAIWGWLPCGLVYSALAWSASSGSPEKSAILMACFGLGTLPWLIATAIAGQQLGLVHKSPALKYTLAFILVSVGLLTIVYALAPSNHHHH